jgi:hypothetical protein
MEADCASEKTKERKSAGKRGGDGERETERRERGRVGERKGVRGR